MQTKTVSHSSIAMTHVMMPQDANPSGNVHGGTIMKYIDDAAAMAAMRHIRGLAVTASIDRLSLLEPVLVGELVFFRASVNMTGRTSLEVGVRVEAENIFTAKVRHVASAYLIFVAVDKNGKPRQVPGLICETENEKRRNSNAKNRKKRRLAAKSNP